jgi:hypothetical protein
MNQHGIQGKNVVVPVKEKLGFRHRSAVFCAHEFDHLMIGNWLMANAKSSNRIATKAVEDRRGLNVVQCAGPRGGMFRERDMPARGCALSGRSIETIRRFVANHSLFVVYHTRRISLPIILGLSVRFGLDTCVQF